MNLYLMNLKNFDELQKNFVQFDEPEQNYKFLM